MIVTTLNDYGRYLGVVPELKVLVDYVKGHDLLHAEVGRIEIDGDKLFINNACPECVSAEDQLLEMHRDYIDVHILFEGEETIGWKALTDIEHYTQDYEKEADCAFSDDAPTAFVKLQPGQMCIAWPEDAHAPVIGKGKIRKMVGKIKI
ncbi:MAG: YhcH/YjgK/YiaL family protein [Bacteroidales bacterium]|nr:YhcH/YjgK/YiaL family protein [Bacteroidales bacterium]